MDINRALTAGAERLKDEIELLHLQHYLRGGPMKPRNRVEELTARENKE
jgi:hypothetical protein